MKLSFTILSFLFLAVNCLSQSKSKEFFDAGYYNNVVSLLEKKSDKKKDLDSEENRMLAESYYRLKNYDRSLELYKTIYSENVKDSLSLVRLIDLNRNLENYDASSRYINEYYNLFNSDLEKSEIIKNQIEFPTNNQEKNSGIEIVPMNVSWMNKGMGYTFYKDEDLIAGVQSTGGNDNLSVVELSKILVDSAYLSIENFKINNETPFYNAYPSYDKKNNILYFTASITKKKKSGKDVENVLQIFKVDLKSDDLTPQSLSFNTKEYNYTHPFITKDGKQLYFVSDRIDGFGGYDIYFVNKENDGWSEPINCGENVNTPFNELTPSLYDNELYFSSFGHSNYGGSDVFKSDKDQSFSQAINMGLPINSSKDDFSYLKSPLSDFALITTNRFDEGETDDVCKVLFAPEVFIVKNKLDSSPIENVNINLNELELTTNKEGEWSSRLMKSSKLEATFDNPYYKKQDFVFEELDEAGINKMKEVFLEPIIISGQLIDDITGKPIEDVSVSLFVKNGDDWELIEIKKSDEEGKWRFHVRKDREYKVVLDRDKYLSHNEIIPRYDQSKKMHNEVLTRMNPFSLKYKVEKDLVIEIDNIYFDFNSSILRKESFPILDKVKDLLNDNADISIELSAHTDCIGKDKYNLWLSQRRAESSRKYLIENGISPDRITPKGYGEQRMIVTDCELQKKDDEEAQKNRRVEVKIL